MSLPNFETDPSTTHPSAALTIETELSAEPAIEPRDRKALSEEQQLLLNDVKIQKRMQNELYVRQHPELVAIVKGFMKQVLLEQPDNVERFAGSFFTDSQLRNTYSQ